MSQPSSQDTPADNSSEPDTRTAQDNAPAETPAGTHAAGDTPPAEGENAVVPTPGDATAAPAGAESTAEATPSGTGEPASGAAADATPAPPAAGTVEVAPAAAPSAPEPAAERAPAEAPAPAAATPPSEPPAPAAEAAPAPAEQPPATPDSSVSDSSVSDSSVSDSSAATADAAAPQAPENAAPTPAGPAPASPAADTPPPAEAPAADMNQLLEQSAAADGGVQQVKVGDKVSGVLVRLGEENCFVDFGGRSEGMIRTTELKEEGEELSFSVGDPLEAFVIDATGGAVQLSRFLSGAARQADSLYKAFKADVPVEGRVMAVNKWGLGVDLEGMRAFCPVSQIDTQFTNDTEQYRDKTMTFKIIRFRDRGRSIVLSRRALLEVEQEKQAGGIREGIVDGAQLTGTVTRLENFGAFVDLGARVEGLIHVSELRHDRVNHPQDVLQPGQEVTVKVIGVKNLGDRRKERISLSIKALEQDPWDDVRGAFPQGTVTMGRIEGIEDYGAFVELAPNVRGLIHVSELADRRVNHPRDVVSIGDEVKVAVLELDNKRKRLRLSIRRAEQVEGETNLKEFAERQRQEKASEGGGNTAMFEALKRANLVEYRRD
jgi:small subunit ribosomal protein S1